MWTIFKLLNLFCVLVTSYVWFTALLPLGPLMLVINVALSICLGFLPLQIKIDGQTGRIMLILIAIVLWTVYNENVSIGMLMLFMYLPVMYLIALPREYQEDLLKSVTKWISILLVPSLILYWATLFINLPGFGRYNYPHYEPFINYLFYIKTTYDTGFLVRFNAFLLEPGHLAMMCEFFMMANRYDFKKNPWMWVMLIAIVFSFSLAGYLITFAGFVLLKVNNVAKTLTMAVLLAGFIFAVQNYAGGENAVNNLILDRLKYDEEKGIQGNNRFFNNTDFEFEKALKTGDYWIGVTDKVNMELVGGSGFKIYILKHGLIGVLLVLAFYIALIPPRPDWHFTLSFLFILIMCFIQNSYPGWYSWLMPYVLSLNLYSRGNSSGRHEQNYVATNIDC